jgi:hypothetical protein
MRKKRSKNKVVCYGYVGRFDDGTLGWGVPTFLTQRVGILSQYYSDNPLLRGSLFEKCKITIEAIPGARRQRIQ